MVDFSDYAAVLTRNLTACVREPTTFLAVLMVQLDGSARLEFIQVRAGLLYLSTQQWCWSPRGCIPITSSHTRMHLPGTA